MRWDLSEESYYVFLGHCVCCLISRIYSFNSKRLLPEAIQITGEWKKNEYF